MDSQSGWDRPSASKRDAAPVGCVTDGPLKRRHMGLSISTRCRDILPAVHLGTPDRAEGVAIGISPTMEVSAVH
jgi:hypothetical protein